MARIYCRQSQNRFFLLMGKSLVASKHKIHLIENFFCPNLHFSFLSHLFHQLLSTASLIISVSQFPLGDFLISSCLSYEIKLEYKFLYVLHLLLGDLLAYFTTPYVNMKYHVMYFYTLYCISSYVENNSAFVFKTGLTQFICVNG